MKLPKLTKKEEEAYNKAYKKYLRKSKQINKEIKKMRRKMPKKDARLLILGDLALISYQKDKLK
jgi:cell division protein FtsB